MYEAQQPVPPVSPTPPVPPLGQGPASPGAPSGPYAYTPSQVSGPEAVLAAARAAREELANQLERLEERRRELSQELRRGAEGENRQGMETRIAAIDQRIAEVEKQIAAADDAVAKAAAIPGAIVEHPEPPPPPDRGPPEGVVAMSIAFILFVLFPLTISYARRLWRRGTIAVAELPKVLAERLTRIDQAVDAIAIEVERISEGQRFLTKVMTDNNAGRTLDTGAAEPIQIDARESVPVPRSTAR